MMTIAISIKKNYWQQILDGAKSVEFRRYSPAPEGEEFQALVHVCGAEGWQGIAGFVPRKTDDGFEWDVIGASLFDEALPFGEPTRLDGTKLNGYPQTFVRIRG